MSRFRRAVAVGGAAVVAVSVTVGGSAAALAAPRSAGVPLGGSVAPFTGHTPATGDVAGKMSLSVQVWLKPDLTAAQRFATVVSTPGSASFRRYLSPSAYTTRFGASQAHASAVATWLRGHGFTGVAADAGRDYVRATAPVSRIDAAFHVTLKYYQATKEVNGGPYRLFANDRPVTLPASLAGDVLGLTGLDNAAVTRPLARAAVKTPTAVPCSHYFGQHSVSGLPQAFGITTFYTAGCGYTAGQLRSAYGMNDVNTGKGQTVAVTELGLTKDMFLTLQDYAKAQHLPAPSPARYQELSLGRNTCGDPFNGEEQLDVEASYAMAPAVNQLVVGGDSCDNGDGGAQGLFDTETAILDSRGGHPLATIVSNSWGSGGQGQPIAWTNIAHAWFVRAVAEGVGMYWASGDSSGLGPRTFAAPVNDPFAIGVGGTTLGIGKTGSRVFETGWSTGFSALKGSTWGAASEDGAASGGPTWVWKEPAYQKGVVPPALSTLPGNRGPVRVVPDLSAIGDWNFGTLLGVLSFPRGKPPVYSQSENGGTSLASPLVAGIVADAQQGQPAPFGFTNPVFYKLAGTSAFNDALPLTKSSPALERAVVCPSGRSGIGCGSHTKLEIFDDQNSSMRGWTGQVTLPGYDDMSGLGTPNGQAFITALRKLG